MKKTNAAALAVIVIILLAVGGYLIFHKSPQTPGYGNSSGTSTSSPSANSTGTAAVNNAILKAKTSSSLGQYLTDPSGKPLYTYNGDTAGVSNCTDTCLASWPAYVDKGVRTGLPTGVSTITRKDNGQVQYTYNGLPLYYFAGDSGTNPTGNGVSNFTIAKPVGTSSSSSSSSSNSTPNNPY